MGTKVIAIGNTLMCDDGIAVRVCEDIKDSLIKNNIEVIIGETDFDYCISNIEDGDFIIIIDAINSGKNPGDITIIPLESKVYSGLSQHGYSLVDLIFQYYRNVCGLIIGIEISEIKFDLELSSKLKSELEKIESAIEENIINRYQTTFI